MGKRGLLVGLATLDFLYLVENYPDRNEKVVALNSAVTAGGPATNAAIAFNYFGNESTLLAVLGSHPLSQLIRTDLERYGVQMIDLEENRLESPPVSSIIVTQGTGDRAVISINATKSQGSSQAVPVNILEGIDIVLIDGHQMAVSQEIAHQAQSLGIPIVVDAGSWKPGFETLLPWVSYAVCSENFYPPNCSSVEDVFAYLSDCGISQIAITCGEKPIRYLSKGTFGAIEVSSIQAVDTLGAGDIFHGAFCHYILQKSFIDALTAAAKIASYSCQFFGTRGWMDSFRVPGSSEKEG